MDDGQFEKHLLSALEEARREFEPAVRVARMMVKEQFPDFKPSEVQRVLNLAITEAWINDAKAILKKQTVPVEAKLSVFDGYCAHFGDVLKRASEAVSKPENFTHEQKK